MTTQISPSRPARTPGEKFETFVLVLILLTVGGFAGAASFTHVHDWTMTNSPDDTGSWFGWANAVVSELVPIAALLVMRRRRRLGQPIVYPASLLVGALVLSITAQLAVARPTVFGGIVSVVPALAFAALAKLVLGKNTPADSPAAKVTAVPATAVPTSVPVTPQPIPAVPASVPTGNGDRSAVPAQDTASVEQPEAITADLLQSARKAAVAHLKGTGRTITRDELRAALRIRTETASEILRLLRATVSTLVDLSDATAEPVNGRPAPSLIGTVTR